MALLIKKSLHLINKEWKLTNTIEKRKTAYLGHVIRSKNVPFWDIGRSNAHVSKFLKVLGPYLVKKRSSQKEIYRYCYRPQWNGEPEEEDSCLVLHYIEVSHYYCRVEHDEILHNPQRSLIRLWNLEPSLFGTTHLYQECKAMFIVLLSGTVTREPESLEGNPTWRV